MQRRFTRARAWTSASRHSPTPRALRGPGRLRWSRRGAGARTFAIEALVDNPDRVLKPGFFAKGTVALRTDQNVLSVPDNAVSTLAGVSNGVRDRRRQGTAADRDPWRARERALGDRRRAEGRRGGGHVAAQSTSNRHGGDIGRGKGGDAPNQGGRAMKLAEAAFRRPVFAVMLTAALIVLAGVPITRLGST